MKTTHGIGLAGVAALFSFGAWLGCSSDNSSPAASPDGGAKDSSSGPRDQSSPPPDTGSQDTGVLPGPDAGGDAAKPAVSCQAYCTTIMANCTGANAQYKLTAPHSDPAFSAMAQCMNFCATMTPGAYGETADSVGCRQYHATAASGNPVVHCPHSGPFGGDLCGVRLNAFCGLATSLCTTAKGNPQQWASAAACQDAAAAYPYQTDAGQFDPTAMNRLNCFEYHLREAYTAPDAAEPDDSGQTVAQSHCDDLIIDPDASPQGSCVQ